MKLNLQKSFFGDCEKKLLEFGEFEISAFRYESGVEALSVKNKKCSFIFLPFLGQQIWHYTVDGRELSMSTNIKEPLVPKQYLENYGGFLYHCGIISMGVADCDHPQHGEIPNAEYKSAYIKCDCDEGGKYIALGGELVHEVAYVRGYRFRPEIKIYEGTALFKINIEIENTRPYTLDYMYLCHINFAPIDGAELVTSAKYDAEHIKIYNTVQDPALLDYIARLEKDLTIMNKVGAAEQVYDPELCFGIKYESDENNRAYTMQYEDCGACIVTHPTDYLPYSIRWISRTKGERAMGMVLPATGEHLGYENAKAKGQLKQIAPMGKINFCIEAGYIAKCEADAVKEKIAEILK